MSDRIPMTRAGYDKLKAEIDDQKAFGALSIPEQQALGQNEINYKHLLRTMNETVSHLITKKYTGNVSAALWVMDDLVLLLEEAMSGHYDLLELSQAVKAKELVPAKKFADADYLGRLSITQIALDALRDDVLTEANFGDEPGDKFKWQIGVSLGKAFLLLQREIENIEANGLPELHNFDVPPMVEPEIPDAPEEEKKPDAVDQELPLKVGANGGVLVDQKSGNEEKAEDKQPEEVK